MSDFYIAAVYLGILIAGIVAPFAATLGYMWVDLSYPQLLSVYLAGQPVALVMGSDMNVLAQRPALRGQIRTALTQAHAVIALSAALKDRVAELGIAEDRIVVQRNGVDGNRFALRNKQDARRSLGLPLDVPLGCFIGNIVEEKGPDLLVDAVASYAHSPAGSTRGWERTGPRSCSSTTTAGRSDA